jgi:hypothetical protein
MMPRVCPREADVLHLVTIGQWPRQADADLVSHAAVCDGCAEVLVVAVALRTMDDDVAAGTETRSLPDGGAVWQRAQWQARQDAMQRAARPVVAVQGIVAVGTVAMIVAGVAWLASSLEVTLDPAALAGGLQATRDWLAASAASMAPIFVVDVPASVLWMVAGAVALGMTVVGVAVGLSTLADLQSDPPARR